jgi:hypothetical protein
MKTKVLSILVTLTVFFILGACNGSSAEWANGTWERSGGVVSFTVEEGNLTYPQAKLDDIKPDKASSDKIVWKAEAMMGNAEITLKKVSDTEATLITKIGDASEEHTFTKKEK